MILNRTATVYFFYCYKIKSYTELGRKVNDPKRGMVVTTQPTTLETRSKTFFSLIIVNKSKGVANHIQARPKIAARMIDMS